MSRHNLPGKRIATWTLSLSMTIAAPAVALAQDQIPTPTPTPTLPLVETYGYTPNPNRVVLEPATNRRFPATDAADIIQDVPGVNVGRMGGHAQEPYIRGLSQGRINIIDDNAFIHGGCPNRMDPPTAYLTLDSLDALTVEKGYATVSNGPGGAGGTVRATRKTSVFDAEKPYQADVSTGYDSNGRRKDVSADVAGGGAWGYVRADANYKVADNYEDGSGQSVRSGFSSHGGRVETGLRPTQNDLVRFSFQSEKMEDALYAGAAMDSPLSETYVLRGSLNHKFTGDGLFDALDLSVYGGQVDHVMDNYSLRDRTGMVMKVESDSDTYGGKLSFDGRRGATGYKIGGDIQYNQRDAVRYMGNRDSVDNNRLIQAYSWPDIGISQVGLFAEADHDVSADQKVRFGLRYDRVDVSADKADRVAAMPSQSANQLYQTYYGVRAEDRDENNIGGLVRYEKSFGSRYTAFAGLSRSVRTADATERGIAQNNNTASNRWVGRPDIKPEKHHQVDVGGNAEFDKASFSGSVFYNRVEDFILRDQARGQDGVLLSDNATVYRNVDATLAGFEVSGSYRLNRNWTFDAATAFTYGENEEDNRPLAQIPPLTFTASVEYSEPDWMAGARLRSAFRQPRADVETNFNSGQDAAKTGGYAVVDLYADVFALEQLTFKFGVTNVFDTTYANHLSRASAFDPEVVQVNEPGRSFFIRAHATF